MARQNVNLATKSVKSVAIHNGLWEALDWNGVLRVSLNLRASKSCL